VLYPGVVLDYSEAIIGLFLVEYDTGKKIEKDWLPCRDFIPKKQERVTVRDGKEKYICRSIS